MRVPSFIRALLPGAAPAAQPAGQALPTPELPKGRAGQSVLPSFMRSAKPNPKSALLREDARLINKDLTTLRSTGDTPATIRAFVQASPDLSAAAASYLRTGITDGYTVVARTPMGQADYAATAAVHQILVRLNYLADPKLGYDSAPSMRSLFESWGMELLQYGAMAGELVLDKALMPDRIQPVSVTQVQRYPSADGKRMIPKQRIAGLDIDLNIPTFAMVELDQDLLAAYPRSPLEAALQPALAGEQLMADLRRVLVRAIQPRLTATVDETKVRTNMSPEVAADEVQAASYLTGVVSSIQTVLDDLTPEQALVFWDSVKLEVMDHGNTSLSAEWKTLMDIINSRLATGTKTLPTILGHSNGTASTASAEVLLYMKQVQGTVWSKINEMMSKLLTTAVRLMGHDAYVEFRQDEIELKPKSELEAFAAMKQSRILDQLSLGLISDEDACLALTGRLPPPGYVRLSGTMFRSASAATTPAGDGYNGATNSGSATNQALKPTTPTGVKGPAQKQPGQPAAGK